MLTILYNVIITPLVYLIELVYAVLNRFFVNPGLSIIGVSLAVNFLALPLYRRADLIQEEEREKQASMKRWVDHIKAHFKGDEQYMMLSTYYRQQGYKPAQALRSSLSLLLQIPFFMAAYNYLSHLGDLEGTRFFFINDLSRPDQLLTIGGIAINVLPIIMTLINCFSTFVYTKGLPLRDKIQAYGLAGIFLVLLYQSPAGLVFYWTCNQVFSLAKNVFFKVLKNPRRVFAILVQVFFIVVGIYIFRSGRFASPRRLIGALIFVALVEAFLFLPGLLAKRSDGGKPEKEYAGPAPTRSFLLAALLITVVLGVLIPSAVIGASPKEFINEYAVQNPLRHIVTTTSILGGLVILWGGVFYYLGNAATKRAMALIYWILAGACLVDFLFFGRGLGTITKNLVFESYPAYPMTEKLLNLAVLVLLAAVFILIWRKKPVLVNPVLGILVIAVLGVSAPNLLAINTASSEMEAQAAQRAAEQSDGDGSGFAYFDEQGNIVPLMHLSTEGRNVVVLFLDRAMGTYFPYILNERPELAEEFDGFTYYPNTLSFGSCTVFGGPPLFGGYDYTPAEVNKRDDELLSEKHDEAIMVMPTLFTEAGFSAVQFDPPLVHYTYGTRDYSNFDAIEGFSTYHIAGAYTEFFLNNRADRTDENLTRSFAFYSLFKAAPVVLQTTIYDEGNYYSTLLSHASSSDFIDNYSVLTFLDDLTSIEHDGSDNYVMLHNDTTHSPQILQLPNYELSDYINNEGLEDPSRFTVDGRTMSVEAPEYLSSYHVNMAAMLRLAEWFDYLRANGVYDNTRIIIVSDHGYPHAQFEDLLFDEGDPYDRTRLNVNSFNPLFMVKDFDAHGFTVSDEFMTNADTPTIALEGIVEDPVNPYTGNPINSDEKTAHDQLVTTSWHHNVDDNHHGTVYETGDGSWYSVHDDIFNRDNWTLVQGPTE